MSWEEGVSIPTREHCGICQQVSGVGFLVPNEIWLRAVPDYHRNTRMCLRCFASFADERVLEWDKDIRFFPVSLYTQLVKLQRPELAGGGAELTFGVEQGNVHTAPIPSPAPQRDLSELTLDDFSPTCDWGDCEEPTVALRPNDESPAHELLPVCAKHLTSIKGTHRDRTVAHGCRSPWRRHFERMGDGGLRMTITVAPFAASFEVREALHLDEVDLDWYLNWAERTPTRENEPEPTVDEFITDESDVASDYFPGEAVAIPDPPYVGVVQPDTLLERLEALSDTQLLVIFGYGEWLGDPSRFPNVSKDAGGWLRDSVRALLTELAGKEKRQ